MTTTKEPSSAEVLSTVTGDLLKTDVLVRVTRGREQREAVLDAFEASGTFSKVSQTSDTWFSGSRVR